MNTLLKLAKIGLIAVIVSLLPLWSYAQEGTATDNPCLKNEADSTQRELAKNPNIKKYEYIPDGLSAVENIILFNDDTLSIYQGGCKDYELKFELNTSKKSKAEDTRYSWFLKASGLMWGLANGADVPFDYNYIGVKLDSMATDKKCEYGKFYLVDETEHLQHLLKIEPVKTVGNRQILTMHLVYGLKPPKPAKAPAKSKGKAKPKAKAKPKKKK